jgi:hypothetical protein
MKYMKNKRKQTKTPPNNEIYEKQKKTKQKHPLKMKYMNNKRKQTKKPPNNEIK